MWYAVSIIALLGLVRCLIVLGVELFREAEWEAEMREARKKAQRAQIKFRGMSYWQEEEIIRKLIKNERRRLM